MTKAQRVLVLWADGESPNLGVRVLGAGASAISMKVWGESTQISLQDFAGAQTGIPMGAKALLRELTGHSHGIRDFIQKHDVVLDTGAGDSFTDIYGFKRMLTIFAVQRLALRMGLPVIMLPQTIGPFETRLGRFLAKLQLRKVSLVMSRDPKSSSVAAKLGRQPELTSSDLVFALPAMMKTKTYDVLLNISGLLWHPNSHVESSSYRDAVGKLVSALMERGREVTLFAHVVNGGANDDDVTALREFSSLNPGSVGVLIPQSLEDARSAIAASNLVIGARMHACLNALSLDVPAVAWAYSRKFEPLLSSLGWSGFVDLKSNDDPAHATIQLLDKWTESYLKDKAAEVAAAGREALNLTANGIRGLTS